MCYRDAELKLIDVFSPDTRGSDGKSGAEVTSVWRWRFEMILTALVRRPVTHRKENLFALNPIARNRVSAGL
jgi:hypothetical protein